MKNRIYVACLAAYNNGFLHGKWIEVTSDYEALIDEVRAMLKASPEPDAEEWAIHDYEGFDGLKVEEYTDFKELCEYVEAIEGSSYDQELIAGVMDNLSITAREAIAYIEDNFAGEAESLEQWAIDFLQETGELENLPKHLSYYFDYAAYARDLELNGDVFTVSNGRNVYIFWNR